MMLRTLYTSACYLLLAACSQTPEPNTAKQEGSLTGVLWELSVIQSMDDSEYVPRAPGLYTIEFITDGSVVFQADCNRGQGGWSGNGASIELTQLATTRAMCMPESISDRYIADLGFVRSYTLNDNKLYLATMADGAILEFFPHSSTALSNTE